MTSTIRDIVESYPRGLQWSYAVTVTGLPDIYSDGLASWSGLDAARTDRPGTLASRAFKLDLRSDPLKPLTTGGELNIDLCDDGTEEVFQRFAPGYTGTMAYVTNNVNMGDATIEVTDGTVFTTNQYVYLGSLETFKVTGTAATQINVTRAQFGSLERLHRIAGTGLGNRLTSSPVTFRGRFLTVWACPVDSTSGLLDLTYASPIWAGQVSTVRQSSGRVQIQCTPLGGALESEWPAVLPSGRVGTSTASRNVTNDMWSRGLKADVVWSNATAGVWDVNINTYPFYVYDEGGTPNYTPADTTAGTYPLAYLIQLIQDTLNYVASADTGYPWLQGTERPYRNSFTLTLKEERPGKMVLRSTLLRGVETGFLDDIEVDAFGLKFVIPPGENKKIAEFDKFTGVGPEDTTINILLDSPLYPFELSYVGLYGYARISDGSKWEIIGFDGVTTNGRECTITGVRRGQGGSEAQAWGYTDETREEVDEKAAVSIMQLLFAENNNTLRPDEVILAALMSTEEYESQNGYCFWSGYRQCLGIPAAFVDYEGIVNTFRRSGIDLIQAFWVEEKGKGKSSLEELCKYYGIHFVTRQFVRNGTVYFGLSVESIDQPVRSYYRDEITDADRVSGSDVVIDHNERLVINVVSFKPYYKSFGTKAPDGVDHFVYDEYSIAEYGAQKAVEIKPMIFDWFTDASTPGRREEGESAHIALATNSAYRWFSALGNGNYSLKMRLPAPVGWRFYPGEHVLVTLTGVRDPNGAAGLDGAAARVVGVSHNIGERAASDIELRMSFDKLSEFAPCARVTAIASTTFTVDANFFSSTTSRSPFNPDQDATDADWFDTSIYGGSIACEVWTEGDYSTVQTFNVTARSGNTLTVSANLTAASVATNLTGGARTVMSFRGYDDALTALQRAFAHIADNGSNPSLGTSADSPKEYN